MNTIKQSFITIIICLVILTGVNLVYSYGPPPGAPPDCPIDYPGCAAPINVSATAQTFVDSKILNVRSDGVGSLGINGSLTVSRNISLRSRIFPGASGTESGYSLVHFKGGTDTAGGIVRASQGTDDLANAPLRFEASSFTFVGNVSANQFCLPGANPTGGCISAWPTGEGGADNDWAFVSGSTIADPIYRTGKVGIGTNSLTYSLEVAGSGIQRIRVNSSDNQAGIGLLSNNTGEAVIYSPNGTDDLAIYMGGANRLYINSSGNVGIGTGSPSPGAKLEVAGQIKITGGNPGDGKVLTSIDASGLASWQTPGSGGITCSGTCSSGNIPKFTGASSAANSQIYDTGTNVGIGTTNPGFKLSIRVNTNLYFNIGAGTNLSGYQIINPTNGIGGGMGYDFTSNFLVIGTFASPGVQAKPIVFSAIGNGIAPKVGIGGTTDPKKSLEVSSGDIYISSATGKLLMKSPDGTCSSCGPNNSDVWSCVSVACP